MQVVNCSGLDASCEKTERGKRLMKLWVSTILNKKGQTRCLIFQPCSVSFVLSGEYIQCSPLINFRLIILEVILYLKFKLSNEKTAFVPRDFYGISLKFMISQCSVRYYNIPRQRYYSIPLSRVTRGHHALKQYGVRELLFVLVSYRRFDLTKDFQDVCYL